MEIGPTLWSSPLTEEQLTEAKKTLSDEMFRQEYKAEWQSHDEHFVIEGPGRPRYYPGGRRRL